MPLSVLSQWPQTNLLLNCIRYPVHNPRYYRSLLHFIGVLPVVSQWFQLQLVQLHHILHHCWYQSLPQQLKLHTCQLTPRPINPLLHDLAHLLQVYIHRQQCRYLAIHPGVLHLYVTSQLTLGSIDALLYSLAHLLQVYSHRQQCHLTIHPGVLRLYVTDSVTAM